ncbi:amidohydrolase family protein [Streptomyces sp. NBC_00554]|uniref:metal-dependent hydrolase family protein n=1 Tax=Streptomyces sp. NBC_00554 TaxID=2903661 RepID=UPI00352EC219|nr:amidohydrolase family protein [Streptomyces sp. NBC_00554]
MRQDEHANAPTLLLRNVTVIDGVTPSPAPGQDVLVEGDRIRAIAPTGTLSLPTAASPARLRILEAGGYTLLPGFFDCHVHVSTSPDAARFDTVLAPESLLTLRSVPALSATLDAGITSARDLAGADSGFREALEAGYVRGPALQIALRILSITGGHGDWRTVSGMPLDSGPGAGAVADSPDEFVRATREVVRQGADWVKVAATGGMTSPRRAPESGGLTGPELSAVVTEAERQGVVGVAAHAQGAAGIAAAVRAGVRSIEHGYLVDDTTLQDMGERGTYLVPTLSALTRPVCADGPPHLVEQRRRLRETALERLSVALTSGVRVVLGTDAGIAPHGGNLRELELLVRLGLSPAAAIAAGTSVAARMCRLDDEVGSVRAGLRADLVLTDVDPLTDIAALGEPDAIRTVIQGGRVVKDLTSGIGAGRERAA